MKKTLIVTFVLLTLASCGPRRPGKTGLPGQNGSDGINGQNGNDGKNAVTQIVGDLGTYVEQGDSSSSFNLTCMLTETQQRGKAVLRIRTGNGGLITVRRAGGVSEELYFDANKEFLLYSKNSGTFIVTSSQGSSTKACNP